MVALILNSLCSPNLPNNQWSQYIRRYSGPTQSQGSGAFDGILVAGDIDLVLPASSLLHGLRGSNVRVSSPFQNVNHDYLEGKRAQENFAACGNAP